MSRSILIWFLLFTLISCNRNSIAFIEMEPTDSYEVDQEGFKYATCSSEKYNLDIAYIEDALQYLIFHVEIESYSKDTMIINSDDFRWSNMKSKPPTWKKVIDKNKIITLLDREKVSIKKAKKSSTIASAILAGLEVISIAATGGTGTALLYAVESGVYIADDRVSFKAAELSVEDELKYIEDWVINETKLPPYEAIGFDILIDRDPYNSIIEIRSLIENDPCQFEFETSLVKK